jgi:hypothetical protein
MVTEELVGTSISVLGRTTADLGDWFAGTPYPVVNHEEKA